MKKEKVGVAVEVGMHRAIQCLQAATAGFQAHCVEPSPVSFRRVRTRVSEASEAVQNRVHLYKAAAGPDSNTKVEFTGAGGTGDHVGDFDMWNMKAGKPDDEQLAKKQGGTVEVSTISLDDIIANKLKNGEEKAFVLKVDTQGFEPAVLSGLIKSLAAHKVQFLLMEYWPHGMDLIMNKPAGTCAAADLIRQLVAAGYTIYSLLPSSHPASPAAAKQAMIDEAMPVHDIDAHCQWFYELEERFPSDTYKMGYWADILAVAPGIQLPKSPVTDLVKDLLNDQT
jgi:FkbM family methyltransferase